MAMPPCPPPDGSRLTAPPHVTLLADVMKLLKDNEFRESRLDPLVPSIVEAFTKLCTTDEDLRGWCAELDQWVRWYRVPAFWLTRIFQQVTRASGSLYHLYACKLYCDAQTHFADDLALSSLETAYVGYRKNQGNLGPVIDELVGKPLIRQLRAYYDYYCYWSKPFAYVDANPCADHLYARLSRSWLEQAVGEPEGNFDSRSENNLCSVISQCKGDGFVFHAVLARRFLGLLYGGQGRHELSLEQYQLGLAEARRVRLDTEIGHLRRLSGWAFRALGKGPEARHEFEQALAFERLEPFFAYTGYWQALSARELGDTIVRFAGRPVAVPGEPGTTALKFDNPEELRPALNAYHDGRMMLNSHMTLQCPFPIGRSAKQQLFRSFSANAIQAACVLSSTKDVLAEVEWAGPREATGIVAEMAAARDIEPAALADFRRNRATYYKALNTVPPRFEDYLANVMEYNAQRRAYMKELFPLAKKLMQVQWCDKIVERTLALRLPNTVFLLFHLGSSAGTMVLLDMESGTAAPFPLAFGEEQLRAIQQEYQNTPDEAVGRMSALDRLMSCYVDLLGPVLEPILPFLPGKQLKIFPRLQMNTVPLHALRLKGKYLIEHCASLSYGQTLGLFLEGHDGKPVPRDTALRIVLGDDVSWYEALLPKIRELFDGASREESQSSWPQLLESLRAAPALDTLFACHGRYDAGDPDGSYLRLAEDRVDGEVRFSRVFAELDLRGCRSVFMGACESGLARAEIGAEYIGLPSAMLSSGVRYVIGALWTIPEVATAVVVARYLELIRNETVGVCAALCQAQREVMVMTRDQLSSWVRDVMGSRPQLEGVLHDVAQLEELPFAHPYYWAGLQVIGDV